MSDSNKTITLFYFRVTDLWKEFCELHNTLFELTCDEYSLLLNSSVEDLELKITEKSNIIERISKVDEHRELIINELNKEKFINKKINGVNELLEYFSTTQIEKEQKHLFRFNALLIDIIEKIQDQNKKNQMFIQKAINSLQDIRNDALGQKNYSTYNGRGKVSSKSIQV